MRLLGGYVSELMWLRLARLHPGNDVIGTDIKMCCTSSIAPVLITRVVPCKLEVFHLMNVGAGAKMNENIMGLF